MVYWAVFSWACDELVVMLNETSSSLYVSLTAVRVAVADKKDEVGDRDISCRFETVKVISKAWSVNSKVMESLVTVMRTGLKIFVADDEPAGKYA